MQPVFVLPLFVANPSFHCRKNTLTRGPALLQFQGSARARYYSGTGRRDRSRFSRYRDRSRTASPTSSRRLSLPWCCICCICVGSCSAPHLGGQLSARRESRPTRTCVRLTERELQTRRALSLLHRSIYTRPRSETCRRACASRPLSRSLSVCQSPAPIGSQLLSRHPCSIPITRLHHEG